METTKTAKERFYWAEAQVETDPVERLRFFCSLAMNGQDWLDVEPFFDALTDIKKDAERYRKLRGWMSSNVHDGWRQVEQLAAIACWVDWVAFDESLDTLPYCTVGLMSKAAGAA